MHMALATIHESLASKINARSTLQSELATGIALMPVATEWVSVFVLVLVIVTI